MSITRSPYFHRRNGAGHAIIELALIGPWLFLLFAVILNFGMFMYTGISVANAARAAAVEAGRTGSRLDRTMACDVVRQELRYLPGVTTGSPCLGTGGDPLTVTMGKAGADITAIDDNTKWGTRVRVRYSNPPLFRLPGMNGQFTIERMAEVRVFQ